MLPGELGAGLGSLVRVRFHGKLTRGWVLGPTDDVPATRILPVDRLVAPDRWFDEELLALARWMRERYVAPLATVLGRLVPPRVAAEEGDHGPRPAATRGAVMPDVLGATGGVLGTYDGGEDLLELCRRGSGAMTLRPDPLDERAVAVEAVAACLDGGRRALVLVPEAAPLPATARTVAEAFGERAVVFAGGDRRTRYRTWRAIREGSFDVVIGTRPAVFAPLERLGLLYCAREAHPGHREERAPSYHVRDVAIARAQLAGAAVVLAALCHSVEAASLGLRSVAPRVRRWPKVEVARPGPEGRGPRLARALREVRRGFVLAPAPGYGIAQVCRACGATAACAACGGALRLEEGAVACVVCGAPGRCGICGAERFAIRRGGAERLAEWAAGVAGVPVRVVGRPRSPRRAEILVGGPDDVRDLGASGLDLVAIADADAAARRPGLAGRERALATAFEAAAWAMPEGRVLVQTAAPSDPWVQALVRGNPDRFLMREREARSRAGFPAGTPVFRVVGDARLGERLDGLRAITALVTSLGERTVCLLALAPSDVAAFGDAMRRLAAEGVVERVEAEPHL